jgi:membrane protein
MELAGLAQMTVTLQKSWAILKQVVDLWDAHSIPRLAAALAFYTVLSLAPFVVLVVGASAMLFGDRITQEDAVRDLVQIVGPEATILIGSLLSAARSAPAGTLSGIGTVLLLFFGASGAFVELRSALNYIWGVAEPSTGFLELVKDRLFAFGMTTGLGFLILACLSTSAAMRLFQPFLMAHLIVPGFVVGASGFFLSLCVTTVAFSLLFRYVPAQRIGWKATWTGGLVTAIAFNLARVPLDLYLTHAAVGSGYGAAASVVVFLMWIYVTAQIFYLGAEFAHLFARVN